MENITIQANVIFKHGDTAYWTTGAGKDYTPAKGEMIIYDAEQNVCAYSRVKYGDGTTLAKNLPFSGSQADWNQSDDAAADYVQNRTHYYNNDGTTVGKQLHDGFISDNIARSKDVNDAVTKALNDAKVYTDRAETDAVDAAKEYVDEEDKFDIDMNTINDFGGIAANTNLNGMTTHEILKKLLYPYVEADVGNATASTNGGTYEKGITKTITSVSITVIKKSEPITSVALYDGSELIEKKTDVANGGTITFSGLNRVVSSNGGKLTVKVTYPDANGSAKTVTKETGAFTFISPYWYGVCGAATEINADFILGLTKDLAAKGTKTYSYTTNAQRMVIAYPSSYGKLKHIKDGNGLDNTGAFGEPTTVSVTSALGVTEEYYVYTNGVTSCSATMTFSY